MRTRGNPGGELTRRADHATPTGAPYPPPPWRLRGDIVLVAAPVRAPRTASAVEAPPLRLPAGWTVGGVLLARYGSGSTLAYHEIVVFSGLARRGARLGLAVSWIAVDSPSSLAGGRAIWALPKRLAEFTWTHNIVTVAKGDAPVLRAHVRRRAARIPLPVLAPFFGQLDGRVAYAVAHGRLRGAPALVELEVPAGSPLTGFGLDGRRPAIAATALDLVVPLPRTARSRPQGR